MTHASPLTGLTTIGIVARNGPDYLRTMLATLKSGEVAVPLRARDDSERLSRSATQTIVEPRAGSGWIDDRFIPDETAEPAQISFTSGTTGAAKAVLLSHRTLSDAVQRLATAMEVTEDIREYIGSPVYHSFGYARGRAVLTAGGKAYIPERFDLADLRRMLAAGEINAISAVPSQWRIVLSNFDLFSEGLDRVRWAEIGSQPMSAGEKSRLREALPNAKIVQHYGMTEASRTSLLRVDTVPEDHIGSVGRAEGGVEIRISPTGLIETRGPHVALGIDDGTAWEPLGPEAWLTTGDQGHLDEGWLYFEGRADDLINCSGIKLSPDRLEDIVRVDVPGAGDFAILRRPDPLRGEGILVVREPGAAPAHVLKEAAEAAAAQLGLEASGAVEVRDTDALPRTDTGKVRRSAISPAHPPRKEVPNMKNGTAAEIAALLGPEAIVPGTTFHDLGQDSLQHLQMTLLLERLFGAAPEDWESTPLETLAQDADTHMITGAAPATGTQAGPPGGTYNQNPDDIGFWSLVREDYLTNDASLAHQGFLMLFVHRFGNWRMGVRPRLLRLPLSLLYKVLNKLTQLFFGMKLDYTVKVGRRVKLEHFGGMILGAREIGDDTTLRQNTTMGIRSTDDVYAKPTIGRFVDIGAGAVIVGAVKIGDNSVIGANSVVYMNVPENSVVVGVPGRIIGQNPRQNLSPLRSQD